MTDEPTDKRFFQYPLCLMNFKADQKQRMEAMLDHAVVSHGQHVMADMDQAEAMEAAQAMPTEDRPSGLNFSLQYHKAYAIGMQRLHVRGGAMGRVSDNWFAAGKHIEAYTRRHGRDAVVRIKTDVWFSCYKEQMTWRDFSTLAGLYSIIGGKPYPVIVYRSMLQARQLGFKSPAIMADELKRRKDLKPLTEDQIRYTLDSLECAGWFARMQASPRRVYFSHRMTREEMAAKLMDKAKAQGTANRNRDQDKELQAKLRALRAGK
jgi:hypothetical protein